MSKSILFVCQSCHCTHPKPPDCPSNGTVFLDRLLNLYQEWSRRSELEIRPVGCLWACNHPCAIAVSSPNKATYILANLPITESTVSETAEAVLSWSQLYLDSKDGNIPWKKFPEVLQTDFIAQVPPAFPIAANES